MPLDDKVSPSDIGEITEGSFVSFKYLGETTGFGLPLHPKISSLFLPCSIRSSSPSLSLSSPLYSVLDSTTWLDICCAQRCQKMGTTPTCAQKATRYTISSYSLLPSPPLFSSLLFSYILYRPQADMGTTDPIGLERAVVTEGLLWRVRAWEPLWSPAPWELVWSNQRGCVGKKGKRKR